MTPFCKMIDYDQSTHTYLELWRCYRLYSKTLGIQPRFLKANVLLTRNFWVSSKVILTILTCFVLWWPEWDSVKKITLIPQFKRVPFRRCLQEKFYHLRPHDLLPISISWLWSSFWLIKRSSNDCWEYKCWERRDFSSRGKPIITRWDKITSSLVSLVSEFKFLTTRSFVCASLYELSRV